MDLDALAAQRTIVVFRPEASGAEDVAALCAGRLPADSPRGLNMVGAVFRLQYATCVRAPVSLLYSAGAFSFRARGVSLHGPRCV